MSELSLVIDRERLRLPALFGCSTRTAMSLLLQLLLLSFALPAAFAITCDCEMALQVLPVEIHAIIARYLTDHELLQYSSTCRWLRQTCGTFEASRV